MFVGVASAWHFTCMIEKCFIPSAEKLNKVQFHGQLVCKEKTSRKEKWYVLNNMVTCCFDKI